MPGRRPRLASRAAALALVIVVGAAQLAWASAGWCPDPGQTHAGCRCCEGGDDAPREARVAGDCCAVEESPASAPVGTADPGLVPPPPVVGAPPVVAIAPVAARAVGMTRSVAIEARAVGPPLWLRIRSLRL